LFFLSANETPKAVRKHFDDDLKQAQFIIDNSTCFAKFLPKAMRSKLLLPLSPTVALKTHAGLCDRGENPGSWNGKR
jgi:hypothetical protein|tara:strand:+ start:139 stop:369 length:231 start_codon:yes stop_codon:yes gene_type:complete